VYLGISRSHPIITETDPIEPLMTYRGPTTPVTFLRSSSVATDPDSMKRSYCLSLRRYLDQLRSLRATERERELAEDYYTSSSSHCHAPRPVLAERHLSLPPLLPLT
jgi:hypothetical protein